MHKQEDAIAQDNLDVLARLIAPFAPHFGEELWAKLGNDPSIFQQELPEYQEELLQEETVTIVVQVNGKVRGTFNAPVDSEKDTLQDMALDQENVQKYTDGKEIIKTIVIPNKLVNIVAQ